jgi:hypothetical protein
VATEKSPDASASCARIAAANRFAEQSSELIDRTIPFDRKAL